MCVCVHKQLAVDAVPRTLQRMAAAAAVAAACRALAHASGVYHDPPPIDRRKLFCAECCATGNDDETWPKPEESGTSATPIRRSRLSERSPQIEALQRRSTGRLHGTATRSPPLSETTFRFARFSTAS